MQQGGSNRGTRARGSVMRRTWINRPPRAGHRNRTDDRTHSWVQYVFSSPHDVLAAKLLRLKGDASFVLGG